MSNGYFSSQELFMHPEVTQHNSHMVMTGVKKPRKSKRLNVDTRFCDDYNLNTNSIPQPVANYNLTLPERVNEIRSMRVTNLEVPISYYNISSSLGNNSFILTQGTNSAVISIASGQYTTGTSLVLAINNAILSASVFTGISFSYNATTYLCTITNSSGTAATVAFGTKPQGYAIPCSERYAMINTVQSLVPTTVALDDPTSANPNANRETLINTNVSPAIQPKMYMRPEDFYTSSQRTARQAAAAQCLKQSPLAITSRFTPSVTVQANTSATTQTNTNLFHNIQEMDVLPFRLGWLLGFRANTLTTTAQLAVTVPANGSVTGTSFVDLNGPRYLYLVVDEFLNGNPHTFTTMLKTSQVRNNVLARVSVNQPGTSQNNNFNTIITANLFNGLLVSDTRTYSDKVNLQRLNVQLVNELGVPMNLNGLDFSFCLEMECE